MDPTAPILRVQRTLWFALTITPPIYVVVAQVARRNPVAPEPWILYAIAGAAVASAVASFALPAMLFAKALRARVGTEIRIGQVALPTRVEGSFRDAPPSTGEVEDPAATLLLAARLDQTPLILTLALRESVALYGLILGILGFPLEVTAGFCAAATLLMALRFPTLAGIARRTEAAIDARVPLPR